MRATTKENSVKKAVQDYLALKRIRQWRINCGMLPNPSGRLVRMAPSGFSDNVAIIPIVGRFFAVESKAPGKLKTLTEVQRTFLETINENGGVGIVVDDVQTLVDVVGVLESDPRARFTIYGERL